MPEDEPVAELEPWFRSRDAAPTPWVEARECFAMAKEYWLSTLRPDARRSRRSRRWAVGRC